jgi:hypothetical protein
MGGDVGRETDQSRTEPAADGDSEIVRGQTKLVLASSRRSPRWPQRRRIRQMVWARGQRLAWARACCRTACSPRRLHTKNLGCLRREEQYSEQLLALKRSLDLRRAKG